MTKSADAFRTISEAAEDLDLPQHVLRFWETRFPQIKPLKRAGGRRFYRPADIQLLATIRQLLYGEGYTIKGVQRLLKDQSGKAGRDGAKHLGRDSEEGADGSADIDGTATDGRDIAAEEQTPPDDLGQSESEPRMVSDDRDALRAALVVITDCERILGAARRKASV